MKITTKTINYAVDTIEQLLLTDGADNDTIIVTDENRGGVFVFRDENSQINNGGTIFNGWTRQYDGAINVKWFGASAVYGSDINTIKIQEAINNSMLVTIPYGIKFNRDALVGKFIIKDNSMVNSFSGPGETNTSVGIISNDVANNDTHYTVSSNHHPVIALDNTHTVDTESSDRRRASLFWSTGRFNNVGDLSDGYRGAGILQWGKHPISDFWTMGIRRIAPWKAIENDWNYWYQGVATEIGTYVYVHGLFYKSTTSGTTGTTAPTHTSGTVSDGGVLWEYVSSSDATLFYVDEHGRVSIGAGTSTATLNINGNVTTPDGGGHVSVLLTPSLTSTNSSIKLRSKDAGGVTIESPYLISTTAGLLRVVTTTGTPVVDFNDSTGFGLRGVVSRSFTSAINLDTTPSVLNTNVLYINNNALTNITALDDAVNGQEVTLMFSNSNTTLVHSATLMLTGSANVTPTAFSTITFLRSPSSISSRWIETARSIK